MLLFIGLFWIVPAWNQPRFLYAMILWDVFVVVIWLADLRRLPDADRLEVRRVWNEPPALGQKMQLTLEVHNSSSASIWARISDDVPDTFDQDLPHGEAAVAAVGSASIVYAVQARARGDVRFGEVWLRYRTSWSLAERWARARVNQTVSVYPNLQEAQKLRLHLIRSRQIEMEKRIKRQRGQGREFEGLREYRAGDEFRDISWSATARRGKLITKVHQLERSQTLWLVLDAGRLLRARANGLTKLDYAVNAALSLAQVGLYSGDRVGLLAYGRKPQRRVAPGQGSAHLRELIESLAQVRAEEFEANHLRATELLLSSQSRRSLIVWLTDLAETAVTPEVVECAAVMSRRHLVLIVIMEQADLRGIVMARPRDAKEMYRYTAALEIVQRRDLLLRQLRQQGAMALEASPIGFSAALVNQYLEIKERSLL
jgi:uncharacterized protein (DUF58 family)